MTEAKEQLKSGYCGSCAHLARIFGMSVCSAWDVGLKREEWRALRCEECLRHGINNDQGEG